MPISFKYYLEKFEKKSVPSGESTDIMAPEIASENQQNSEN